MSISGKLKILVFMTNGGGFYCMIFHVRHVRKTCVKFISSESSGIRFLRPTQPTRVAEWRDLAEKLFFFPCFFLFFLLQQNTPYAVVYCGEMLGVLVYRKLVYCSNIASDNKAGNRMTCPRCFRFCFGFRVNG